jgi:glycosyltransferase involved in cell wall biosynthesis
LKDTIISITQQTLQPDEVIVVDNDSNDNTKDVVLSFAGLLNIKYIFEPVRGIPFARNTGIKNAIGDIIAFIDDDCVADENWLKFIEAPFTRDPNIGTVGGELSYLKLENGYVENFYARNMVSRARGNQ